MRTSSFIAFATSVFSLGCSQELPLAARTGWTIRYAHHTGAGDNPLLRGIHPDVVVALLNGHGRFIARTGVSARLDHATGRAESCLADRCTDSPAAVALAAVMETEGLQRPPGRTESDVGVEYLNDRMEVASLHTDGARFTAAVGNPGGHYVFTVEARWIVQPGDPTVEVAKDFFVSPLERLGADRLVAAIRRTAGLPLMFDVHVVNDATDGNHAEGSDVYRAIEVGNAPPAL